MIFGALTAIQVINQIEADRYFEDAIKDLPIDMVCRLRRARAQEKDEARREATQERRHRELCDAIRSTSFWRF